MNTYDMAPSTEINTCPAPVFATGEATVRSLFDYAGKLPRKVRTEHRQAKPQLAPSTPRVARITTHEVTTARPDDEPKCAHMNKHVL